MAPHLAPVFPVLASLRVALDQPVFPGKVLVWLLIMISIVGWVMILSAFLRLRRMRAADRRFTERLRQSKTTLEVFEEGWEDDDSPRHLIYHAGARETAYQLLGSREPQESMNRRLREAGKLSGRQVEFLRLAFRAGYRAAVARLETGIASLRLVSSGSLLLGAFGFVWTLMAAFDAGGEFAEVSPRIGGALSFLVLALLVAGPASIARLALRNTIAKRREDLARYRDDIRRLFERSFVGFEDVPASPAPTTPRDSPKAGGDERSGRTESSPDVASAPEFVSPTRRSPARSLPAGFDPEPASDLEPLSDPVSGPDGEAKAENPPERKRYRSIRDRLLRGDDEDENTGALVVNPIARQAAAVGLRGY